MGLWQVNDFTTFIQDANVPNVQSILFLIKTVKLQNIFKNYQHEKKNETPASWGQNLKAFKKLSVSIQLWYKIDIWCRYLHFNSSLPRNCHLFNGMK